MVRVTQMSLARLAVGVVVGDDTKHGSDRKVHSEERYALKREPLAKTCR